MPDASDDRLERLSDLGRTLRRQYERAEARIPRLNAAILDLDHLGLLPRTIFLGPIIYDWPYDAAADRGDSHEVFQAALLIPGGLGAVAWDSDDHAAYRRSPSGHTRRAFDAFARYDRCSPGIRALLLPQVDDLIDQLLQQVEPPRPGEGEGGAPTAGPPPLAGL